MSFISSSYDENSEIVIPTASEEEYRTVQALYDKVKGIPYEEKPLTDKISSEDFIKAFGEGVKQMGNVKPIVIDCKYYLPCGRCDKTNGLCSQLGGIEDGQNDRPQGEWIYNQYDGNVNIGNWHCSECRHIEIGGCNQKPNANFCSNCGARMGKEKKNETN